MNQYDRIFLLVKEAKAKPKKAGVLRRLITLAKGHNLPPVEALGKMSPEEKEKAYETFKTTVSGRKP